MTGYHNATQHINKLHIAIVNQDGKAREAIQNKIMGSRQLLLLLVSIFILLIIVSIIHLFVEPAAPFWKMWLFESCVFLSSICVTQMGLALFGHFALFFKSAACPANVNDREKHHSLPLLAPLYQHIGQFLPSGVPGFMQLIYIGQDLWSFVLHLLPISIMTWGITVLKTSQEKSAPVPVASGTTLSATN
ncbi:hypothetical protein G8C92_08130 [Paenibacillus donghaensis]|uniref:hypothetical protein n=1 Tax=Paenibacillus donghaensis TaxID=414771 RepID=UPI0018835F9F|nr:hypothetical protein [Paenibacillus donghaensis]MBE9914000.1 hypothetical protein [Paenibacillus donghaensis]